MWYTMPNDLKKAHACRGMPQFKDNAHGIATIEVTGYIYDRHYLLHKCYPSITVKLVLHPGLEAASIQWPWKYLQYLDDTVSIGRRVVTDDPGRKPLQFKHVRIMVRRLQ